MQVFNYPVTYRTPNGSYNLKHGLPRSHEYLQKNKKNNNFAFYFDSGETIFRPKSVCFSPDKKIQLLGEQTSTKRREKAPANLSPAIIALYVI